MDVNKGLADVNEVHNVYRGLRGRGTRGRGRSRRDAYEVVGLEDTRSSSSRTLSLMSSSSYLRTSEYHFRRNSEVEWLAVYSLGSTTYSSAPCSNTFSLYLFPRDGGELSRIYPASLKPPSHTSYDSRQKSRPVTGPASNPIVIFVSARTTHDV